MGTILGLLFIFFKGGKMDEIVLKMNLKYVLAALSMNERGELLTALLEGEYQGHNQSRHQAVF